MAEVDRIKKKITALLNKTIDRGCTEQEAMTAAEKAGELMDHYNLQMTDLEIREEKCVQLKVATGGIKRGPVDACVIALAKYCDVKVWFSSGRYTHYSEDGGLIGKTKRGKYKTRMIESSYGVFGIKSDTELYEYLFAVIKTLLASELKKFQETDAYNNTASYYGNKRGGKISATMSFQQGMASGISEQLLAMKQARRREMKESSGRDLVIVKEELIKEEWEHTGIQLSRSTSKTGTGRNYNAKNAGREAGMNAKLNAGINGGGDQNAIA